MRRRAFIAGLGAAAASPTIWPTATRAQQMDRLPWIAVLTAAGESDVRNRTERAAFTEALAKFGWTDGRDVRIEHRWGEADDGRIHAVAAELAGKGPNVILASGTQVTGILKRQTGIIPVVFVNVADPVASGFVASFARPAGNITGFTSVEFSFAGKWLSILRDLEPGIANVMVLYFPDNSNWTGYLRTIEAAAESLHIAVRAAPMAEPDEMVAKIETFAREPSAGMIVLPGGQTIANREMIAALAARHRLPAVYPYSYFTASGGLASYGSDTIDIYRRAAGYVDRILHGARPADLPVQAPTKFEFVLNLKAAKAIGLTVPVSLQLLADEVIE
jgi:putative ABC transport system substrate-binding protein